MYVPQDVFLWDFWLAPRRARPGRDDGHPCQQPERFHLFYLQAPRSLPDPELRHTCARVGHAVSADLRTWQPCQPALEPGSAGAWDDLAIWTGSVVERSGVYYQFYTAINQAEQGRVQRIGLAISTDLTHWERHPGNPVLTADPRWYETANQHPAGEEHWRDPYVIFDAERGAWLMFLCARANDGPLDGRGVIGLARSFDLLTWEPLPPASLPGEFGQLEVPNVTHLAGRWYLLFCTASHSAARLARAGSQAAWHGTHYLVSSAISGPYLLIDDSPLCADAVGTYYGGRIEPGLTGEPLFLAWRRLDPAGRFLGGLSEPAPVTVLPDGRLRVDSRNLWPDH